MKKILAILICALMILPVNAAASEQLEIKAVFDAQTEDVLISGKGPSGDIIITVESYDNIDEFSDTNPPLDIISIKNTSDFNETIELSDKASGKKLIVTATSADGSVASDAFINPDFNSAESLMDEINGAASLSEFKSLVSANSALFGFDTQSDIYISSNSEIYNILYAIKPSNSTPAQVYKLFYTACALAEFNGVEKNEVERILSDNAVYLGIDYDADYVNDARIDSDSKDVLCEILSEEKFSNVLSEDDTFALYFEEIKALANIKTADVWQDIKNAMENDFKNLFTISSLSPSKAQNVYSKMMSYTYSNFEDIKDSYNKAIKSVESENKGSSSSSSGGGGSFGGGAVTLPPSVEIDISTGNNGASATKTPMVTLSADASSNFSDVPATHWGYKAVSLLADAGIVSGYDENTFGPEINITRAEFTKLICASFGIPSVKAEFSDVSEESWYNGYVGGAGAYGIINGYGDMFNPDSFITREDAAVIAYRALKNEGIILNGSADFDDSMSISLYALPAVGAFKEYGILQGDGTNFYPQNNITRVEAAQLLYKVLSTQQ